ncbi:cysteine desulfurase [Marinospirillum celere]|uniref:cysteine desulfurase n=1 Tax=Marinospirillum celere TaxID=1122252 RepID=A0A1I1EQ67_9GAMM|nr:cysteine desulfurase family protein [Marinospirillum celere]SFB87023.1 cysteine desulfurase [Marinospirillum celere]
MAIEKHEPIYFDYQATTPVDPRVFEAMKPYYKEEFGNPHSDEHSLGWNAAKAVTRAKEQVASLINALPEEVLFTSGATESNNHVFAATMMANKTDRRTILISSIEHKSVSEPAFFYAELLGYKIVELPVHPTGLIDMECYKKLLDEDVLLVSIMAVNNEVGTVQDIPALSNLAHEQGVLFHTDAAQATTNQLIDVLAWDVDFMSFSAHKMYGPKGIGALFIHTALLSSLPPLLHGGGQQNGLRAGTLPTPLCVGFGEAARIIAREIETDIIKYNNARKALINGLIKNKIKFKVNGNSSNTHPGNLSITILGFNASELVNAMQPYFCLSTSSACNSGTNSSNSTTLQRIGLSEDEIACTLRISFGKETNIKQINFLTKILARNTKIKKKAIQ